jgi:hypothetical protein
MRWFLWSTVLMGCGGTGDPAPDATFSVTVTNVNDECTPTTDNPFPDLVAALDDVTPDNDEISDYCPCTDINGDCGDVVDRSSETFSYEYHRDGDNISLRIDGEDFASGAMVEGCVLEYETPVWLDSPKGGDVQWRIKGSVLIDTNGACKSEFEGDAADYDFLGIERVEIMGGENPDYPIGRTAWKIISGTRTSG